LNGDVTAPGTAADSDIPSFGFNLSYMWGDEGNKSWLKFNGAGGPEGPTKKGWSFLGDLNGNFAVSDAFWIGAEGVYRQDDGGLIGAENAQFIAGQLKGRYAFSDVWDGTLRYSFVWDLDEGQAGGIPPGPGSGQSGWSRWYRFRSGRCGHDAHRLDRDGLSDHRWRAFRDRRRRGHQHAFGWRRHGLHPWRCRYVRV
jgi:hypothetical protein